MTQLIPAAMVAADVATQAELDAAIAGEVTARNSAITAGNVKLSGDLVQTAFSSTTAVASGTTIIPLDDTVPQQTEGDQYLSVTITPTSASNILDIDVLAMLATSAVSGYMTSALFQDSNANALAAGTQYCGSNNAIATSTLRHRMVAGTTSPITFKVRCGGNNAGTTTLNGQSGGRIFGGVLTSSIRVRELKA